MRKYRPRALKRNSGRARDKPDPRNGHYSSENTTRCDELAKRKIPLCMFLRSTCSIIHRQLVMVMCPIQVNGFGRIAEINLLESAVARPFQVGLRKKCLSTILDKDRVALVIPLTQIIPFLTAIADSDYGLDISWSQTVTCRTKQRRNF